jgi:hypothetical protein
VSASPVVRDVAGIAMTALTGTILLCALSLLWSGRALKGVGQSSQQVG